MRRRVHQMCKNTHPPPCNIIHLSSGDPNSRDAKTVSSNDSVKDILTLTTTNVDAGGRLTQVKFYREQVLDQNDQLGCSKER